MKNPFKGRSLLTLKDLSGEEVRFLLDLSHRVKKDRVGRRFTGKTLALVFEKRSTRTRCAFETAFGEEGGHPVFLSLQDIQLGAKETLEDTARILGRMFDAVLYRGFEQKTAEILASYSGIPVYNGLTDSFHPTQILADLMTVEEEYGRLDDRTLAFVGDCRNNVASSVLIGCAKTGLNVTFVCPEKLAPSPELLDYGREEGGRKGVEIRVTTKIEDGIPGADVIYTDVWVSMGEEEKMKERIDLLKPYQVNRFLMELTGRPAIFLHCLPAVRENEVTSEVLDGESSRAWDQAENRKHTGKALMAATL